MDRRRTKYQVCPNCGHQLHTAHFCPECGQPNHDLNVPIKHLLGELLESTLHLDSKSFRTITALLLKPGFLTTQFNTGKRQSYVPPLRLYIFLSFMFFFILAVRPKETEKKDTTHQLDFSFYSVSSQKFTGASDRQIDSILITNEIDTTTFNKYMARQVRRMTEDPSEFRHSLGKNISYMMFALMPLNAFFLFLLHRMRVRYYLECLIFSIHFHSLIFLLLIFFLLLNMMFDAGIILIAVLSYSLIYLFISIKRVFSQNALQALYKTVILAFVAPISIAGAFILTILMSVILY